MIFKKCLGSILEGVEAVVIFLTSLLSQSNNLTNYSLVYFIQINSTN